MKLRGIVPTALVLNAVNPIYGAGRRLAEFTMLSGSPSISPRPFQTAPSSTSILPLSDRSYAGPWQGRRNCAIVMAKVTLELIQVAATVDPAACLAFFQQEASVRWPKSPSRCPS